MFTYYFFKILKSITSIIIAITNYYTTTVEANRKKRIELFLAYKCVIQVQYPLVRIVSKSSPNIHYPFHYFYKTTSKSIFIFLICFNTSIFYCTTK
jgi:hypothetical protein